MEYRPLPPMIPISGCDNMPLAVKVKERTVIIQKCAVDSSGYERLYRFRTNDRYLLVPWKSGAFSAVFIDVHRD